jgi:hypothetical protein
VRQGHAGAVIKCHAQCDTADVLAALGLVWADLADQPGEHNGHRVREPPLDRAARIINLRGEMLPLEPPTGWGERTELAEGHTAREADGHYWRTLARWAALARDERYVRQAYRDQRARIITYEQRMVLATRAEDLRRESAPPSRGTSRGTP